METMQTRNGLVDMDQQIVEQPTTVRNIIDNAKCASEDCVSEHPIGSTLVALGAGAFVGLIVAATMCRRETRKRDSYFSKVRSQIADSVGSAVPDSFSWRR